VVFGSISGVPAELELLGSLNGTTGFKLSGAAGHDRSGYSVSDAGDINGDGYDDLIVGAPSFTPNTRGDPGAAYVIFGKGSGFASNLDLSSLDGENGFKITATTADRFGFSVSSAGDVNGDGFDDLIVGAPYTGLTRTGTSYVIHGGNFTGSATHIGDTGANTLTGGAAADRFVAGQGDDTMAGGGGADVFRGGAGNDRIEIIDSSFVDVDGGSGRDTLALAFEADFISFSTFDLTAMPNSRISGIEVIDLFDGARSHLLKLGVGDLLDLSETSNTLKVNGDSGDSVTVTTAGWADGGVVGDYHIYTLGTARLEVNVAITDVNILEA
jgi:hypothetical protein